MKQQFKIGDVVVLKSGGVEIIIASVEGEYCQCVWLRVNSENTKPASLAEKDELASNHFIENTLRKSK
jgi:uncharacterized protein YodC (DUF2158 family)